MIKTGQNRNEPIVADDAVRISDRSDVGMARRFGRPAATAEAA